ncbi:MarR family winged helix-turn-helix transcriptional regulator [Nonomuraea turcica]|uniref:MarR family winged helix-turn-helix transcriptional regulator n=1 Tax=Nonomuraea sp. G32 TaxID=3067274 RepID=UPI00273A8B05|nr:helix-turn-helix domain-containing protein [Nonomuraea sp. G32]MDP4504338.1 helix-turn-helix domain-containing protein [Nonomuraea sp. G32]
MNIATLRRLGRRLGELAKAVDGEGRPLLTPGEEAVFEDVLRHPGSAVGEIQARTGFAQSHVSASVARMRERGILETGPDPADGRRTQVRVADAALHLLFRRATTPVEEVVRRAVPDSADADRAVALLKELEALLITDDSHGAG